MTHSRSRAIVIAAAGAAVLFGLAGIVSLRLGGDMDKLPMNDANDMTGKIGNVGDLSELAGAGTLPVLADEMPPFSRIAAWLNSEPLTPEALKGKVTLVDFWTYSCINCIRTLPYVTAWHEKYKDSGFTVVGVHTPEFAFEKSERNVRTALERHKITYPVALDNDYGTWNNYENHYWPAKYLFDAQGRLRYTHFGEGEYAETERHVQALIAEAGKDAEMPLTEMPPQTDFSKIGSPETYVGYGRQERFASPEAVIPERETRYSIPASLALNEFALGGVWSVGEERARLARAPGEIAFRYRASAANLVMGAPSPVRAEVTIDGAPVPEAMHGPDIVVENGKTYLVVSEERLYNLVDAKGDYATHTVRVRFLSPGVDAYAFTFG